MGALVVVTGGSAGLGRALLAAAPAGADRLDVSRCGPDLDGVDHLAADLADPSAWAEVGSELGRRIAEHDADRITVVLNAGTIEPIGFAGEVDADAYARGVLLNAAAPQVVGHHVLAALARHPAPRRELVAISSGAARKTYPGWSSYGAAKAGLDHWVRAVADEQQRRGGVRVHAIAPGVVATGMQSVIRDTPTDDFPPVERFHQLYATGELLDPDDVARRLWAALDDPDLPAVCDLRDR
ncbi:SDR family NAD(P)-dependent oxidoreductase [Nitriliruptoraceae bacterium ZYF776]|nr:SDR family NAD(P)-dependent oxidoreductase [Profundirhabdus halotolerans]